MAVNIKAVPRGEPGVEGGGEIKYYASPNITGNVDIDELSELIELISTISDIDIAGVLKSLTKVIPRELAKGKSVRLGDLGFLRVSVSSRGEENPEDVGAHSVTKRRIIFTPGPGLKKMLNNLEFTIINGEE